MDTKKNECHKCSADRARELQLMMREFGGADTPIFPSEFEFKLAEEIHRLREPGAVIHVKSGNPISMPTGNDEYLRGYENGLANGLAKGGYSDGFEAGKVVERNGWVDACEAAHRNGLEQGKATGITKERERNATACHEAHKRGLEEGKEGEQSEHERGWNAALDRVEHHWVHTWGTNVEQILKLLRRKGITDCPKCDSRRSGTWNMAGSTFQNGHYHDVNKRFCSDDDCEHSWFVECPVEGCDWAEKQQKIYTKGYKNGWNDALMCLGSRWACAPPDERYVPTLLEEMKQG